MKPRYFAVELKINYITDGVIILSRINFSFSLECLVLYVFDSHNSVIWSALLYQLLLTFWKLVKYEFPPPNIGFAAAFSNHPAQGGGRKGQKYG